LDGATEYNNLKKIDKGKLTVSTIKNENIKIAELNIRKESKFFRKNEFSDKRINRIRLIFFVAHTNRFPIFVYLKISIRSYTLI
jgi:hypothetical protein